MQFFPATPLGGLPQGGEGSLAEYKKTGGEEELFLKTGSCDLNRALRDVESLHASFYHRALIPSQIKDALEQIERGIGVVKRRPSIDRALRSELPTAEACWLPPLFSLQSERPC